MTANAVSVISQGSATITVAGKTYEAVDDTSNMPVFFAANSRSEPSLWGANVMTAFITFATTDERDSALSNYRKGNR